MRTSKNRKIFSANNEQGTMKRGETRKVVSRKKFEKKLTSKIFGPSHSRYAPLKAWLPLPSSCCKGEACLPRLHFKGDTSSPKWCIEGLVRTSKNRKIFSADNEQGTMKRGQKWFPEKLLKYLT